MPIISGDGGAPFTGGTVTGGITFENSGITFDAVAGEAIHIDVGSGDSIRVLSGATVLFSVDRFGFAYMPNGASLGPDDYLYIQNASVPADGLLGASQVTLWLDATPAATKLMVKAKDSGGTVRTAAINLA